MQDRVAEVLVERESLGQQNPAGLVISVAAHAAVFFFLIFSPHREPTTIERPRVITMRLAPAGSQPPARAIAAPRQTAVVAQTPAAKPVVETPVPPASIAQAPPPPVKPARTDPARTGEKSVFGTTGKPAPASTPAPAAPAAVATTTGGTSGSGTFAVPGVGSAGVTGLEGGDFPYDVYIDRMTTKIGENWFRPGSAGDMITRVHFIIERDGRIRDAKIEESSGDRTFDRAALRSVIESSPLPPLPGQYSGRYLGVYLTFH